jgi:hypothetical protein
MYLYYSLQITQQQETANSQENNGVDFTVMVVASGPVRGGGLVHAVAVTQPVQSWTVIRGQDDFLAVGDALSAVLPGLPPCPAALDSASTGDINALIMARNDLQQWLTVILMHPGARESPAVLNFLTYAANMIPPQFEGVPWTSFTPDGSVLSPSEIYSNADQTSTAYASGNLDDMEMDDMFDGDDDGGPLHNDDSDDDEELASPSIRYKPTDEPITEEDEMDIMQLAGEVEMIEDVGSLAQSLGASHIGRSLQLQAEMFTNKETQQAKPVPTGLTLRSAVPGASGGGIGGAMERAIHGLGDSFTPTKPESAPRLDSFKMIKVIGKGSFGKQPTSVCAAIHSEIRTCLLTPVSLSQLQVKYFSSRKSKLAKCLLSRCYGKTTSSDEIKWNIPRLNEAYWAMLNIRLLLA